MKLPFQLWNRRKYFYYRLPGEKTFHSTGLKSERQAIDRVYEIIREGKSKDITLKKYAKNFFKWDECDWIRRQHAKNRPFSRTTATMRRGHLKNYLFPEFGETFLADINPVRFEDWLVNLHLSNQSRIHILYTLNIILKEAKREKLISANPLDDVEPMASDYTKRDVFTLAELKQLFPDDSKKRLEIWKELKWLTLFNLMTVTGIRSGEVRALTWQNVLWDIKGILILQAVKADGTIGEPKKNEKRGIYIPSITCELLSEWYQQTTFDEPSHLIFFGEDFNRPLEKRTLLSHFRAALDQAEIDRTDRVLVVHSLRHTYNTIMREVLPEKMLREFTGHRSMKMTDRYDHPELERRLRRLEGSRKLVESVWT